MSKVSRERAQQNRERVVQTAAQLFRERGFEGVGIADLMKQAGLTHGGFYAQFSSKEQLMAEACNRAFEQRDVAWREVLDKASKKNLSVLASVYLSDEHLDEPGTGCPAVTLAADTAHQGPLVRTTFTAGVKRFLDLVMQLIPGRSQKTRRREAIASYAAMIGGVVLARAVNDEALASEILDAVRVHIANMDEKLAA